ncbi:uncharacterized protein MEPE_02924 [Melanopsichium pennsylvanicum]|uniref:FAD/NAD(P)-binding domain-containing protein n=2 Tax=Melanopsichium pennsylvanicum TaxID=63383 RepID=A0AAJ4XLM1_9BASI|nr:hypothetical iron uptake cluster protein [Melanopsichium pennsylvanicum 4]SNX84216.1 uncharacterized protein MEPE_02924 [Melanopsichium pennsylvanicum]
MPAMAQPVRLKKLPAASASASSSTFAGPSSAIHSATAAGSASGNASDAHTQNIVVLGGSYGGMHAATVLAQKLPSTHRVILIERNSHFNHLYVFPRFSVLPGHEHKAFIPYSSIFKDAPARPKSHIKRGRSSDTQPVHSKRSTIAPLTTATPTANMSRNALEMGSTSSLSNAKPSPSRRAAGSASTPSPMADVPEDSQMNGPVTHDDSNLFRSESPASSRAQSQDSRRSSQLSVSTESSAADSDSNSSTYDHASTAASSYIESDIKVVGPEGIESEIAHTAEKARHEEQLGRPEIQVTELSDAVQHGLDLDGVNEVEDSESDQVANGFENSSPHIVLQATVTDISSTHVTVTPTSSSSSHHLSQFSKKKSLWSIDSVQIPYSHLVYALGSHLPDPLRTEARFKADGTHWMREIQERVKASNEIVLVGGGALGVQFATDIASVHPGKKVTLIHSRKQLLPNFDERVHEIAYHRLKQLGVNVVLGERLALTEGCPRGSTVHTSAATEVIKQPEVCVTGDAKGEGIQAHQEGMCVGAGRKLVRTTGGKRFECDLLLLCTGQQPNSSLMAKLSPSSVDPGSRLVRVHRSLQVAVPDPRDAAQQPFDAKPPCGDCDCFLDKKAHGADLNSGEQGHLEVHLGSTHQSGKLSNVYAIGDVADAFGALNAGYQAWNMADVATENILRDIQAKTPTLSATDSPKQQEALESPAQGTELVEFNPAVNMLKLSLGLGKMVFQGPRMAEDTPKDKVNPEETGALDGEGAKDLKVNGRIPGTPEITIKDDPNDLGVEGVWSFMANADTSDMYR